MKVLVKGKEYHVFTQHNELCPCVNQEKQLKRNQCFQEYPDILNIVCGANEHNRKLTHVTVVKLTTQDGFIRGCGQAFTSAEDQFCKKTGRKLALARCLKQTNLTKKERQEVFWQVFPQYRAYK